MLNIPRVQTLAAKLERETETSVVFKFTLLWSTFIVIRNLNSYYNYTVILSIIRYNVSIIVLYLEDGKLVEQHSQSRRGQTTEHREGQ